MTNDISPAILQELKVLVKVRSVSKLRESRFPLLEEASSFDGDSGDRFQATTAVLQLVDSAIDSLADGPAKSAAGALLRGDERRWRTVGDRRRDAGAAYGIGHNHFRNEYEVEVLEELQYALNEIAVAAREHPGNDEEEVTAEPGGDFDNEASKQPATQPDLESLPVTNDASASSHRVVVLGAILLAGLLGAALVIFNARESPADEQASPTPLASPSPTPDPLPASPTSAVTPTQPPAATTDPSPAVSNLIVQSPIDISFYCRDTLGPSASAMPIASSSQWRCVHPSTGPVDPPLELDTVCERQFGVGARAESFNTASPFEWRCIVEFRPSSPRSAECQIAAGESLPSLGVSPSASATFNSVWASAKEVDPDLACASSFVHEASGGLIQELGEIGGSPLGAIFEVGDGEATLLTGGAWDAWDRIIRGLDNSFGGFPIAEIEVIEGVYSIRLRSGTVMVASSEAGPYYSIITFSYPIWLQYGGASGCLGMPINDPAGMDPGFFQPFETGIMRLDLAAGAGVEVLDSSGEPCEAG